MNAPIPTPIQVDFKHARLSYVSVGNRVYQRPGARNKRSYYERPTISGKPTWRKLSSTTKARAEEEVAENRKNQRLARMLPPLAHDPYFRSAALPISDLCDFYLESGCPKARSNSPRAPKALAEEIAMVATLKKWWGKKPFENIYLEDCRAYYSSRLPKIRPGLHFTGQRQVDRELVALSNIFRWAARNSRYTGVTHNPIAHDREKFQDGAGVQHCREFQPASGDELHALARELFDNSMTEVLGWQLLFEAMIGSRTCEILQLRLDARDEYRAGYIRGRSLFLLRKNSTKGTYPYAKIHAALEQCLAAHRAWHSHRYGVRIPSPRGVPRGTALPQTSPWYFPSPYDPDQPVSVGALTKALRRVTKTLDLPKRTSHGLRSFFVNVLRSQDTPVPDAEIALRIGQKGGGKLIVTTYGEIMEYKIAWLPSEDPPAWSIFAAQPPPTSAPPELIQSELLL